MRLVVALVEQHGKFFPIGIYSTKELADISIKAALEVMYPKTWDRTNTDQYTEIGELASDTVLAYSYTFELDANQEWPAYYVFDK